MTSQEFDSYRFSINTVANCWDDQWEVISEVNFKDRTIIVNGSRIVRCSEIKGLMEGQNQ